MKSGLNQGVTLIELLVTVSLIAIVLSLAAPSFRELMLNNQRASHINAMMASLNLARAEAIKRGTRTVVCISDGAAPPDCAAAPKGWEEGWIVFIDDNVSGASLNALDDPEDANDNKQWDRGEDALLDVHGPLAGGTTLRGNNSNVAKLIWFSRLSTSSWGTVTHCDSRGDGSARGIVISPSGRARLTSDSNGNGTEDNDGTPLVELTCP